MIRLSVTLVSGEVYSAEYKKLPAHWKSVAMALAPYGSDLQACTFKRERI